MSDDQVGFICLALVAIAFIGLVALRLWLEHKEAMK